MSSISHVAWGGKTVTVEADIKLGIGSRRKTPAFGFRRAVWDAAFGYVNGFALTSIAYYVLTRSLSQRIWHYTFFREIRRGYIAERRSCGGTTDHRTGQVVWCPICEPGRGDE